MSAPPAYARLPGNLATMTPDLLFRPADLHLYHRNPRTGDVKAIEGSLRAHGQYKPIVVNKGTHTGRPYEVLAGNHTLMAIRNLAESDPDDERWHNVLVHEIDVDDDRAARIVLADNRTSELGSFDSAALTGLLSGLPDLSGTGYSEDDLKGLSLGLDDLPPITDPEAEEKYTPKVDIPQYTPSGTPPPLSALMDRSKTEQLEQDIDASGLPQELRDFLRYAAQRHTVIDFHHVADYYAHAEPEVQRLFEAQVLVIIDLEDAIRDGYTRFSETISEIREQDLSEDEA